MPLDTLGEKGRQNEDGEPDLTASGQQGYECRGQVHKISHLFAEDASILSGESEEKEKSDARPADITPLQGRG